MQAVCFRAVRSMLRASRFSSLIASRVAECPSLGRRDRSMRWNRSRCHSARGADGADDEVSEPSRPATSKPGGEGRFRAEQSSQRQRRTGRRAVQHRRDRQKRRHAQAQLRCIGRNKSDQSGRRGAAAWICDRTWIVSASREPTAAAAPPQIGLLSASCRRGGGEESAACISRGRFLLHAQSSLESSPGARRGRMRARGATR